MSKKKTTTQTGTTQATQQAAQQGTTSGTNSTQNQFGYMTPTDTADFQALRGWKPQVDPGISYTFGRARQALKNQFTNPLGADAPAAVRDAAIYAGENDIAQDEAQAYRSAYNDVNQQEYQKLASLAQMTRPELVGLGSTNTYSGTTTGSSSGSSTGQSSGKSVEETPLWQGLAQGAANAGLAFA